MRTDQLFDSAVKRARGYARCNQIRDQTENPAVKCARGRHRVDLGGVLQNDGGSLGFFSHVLITIGLARLYMEKLPTLKIPTLKIPALSLFRSEPPSRTGV